MTRFGLHLYTYVRSMTDQTWDVLPRLKNSAMTDAKCH